MRTGEVVGERPVAGQVEQVAEDVVEVPLGGIGERGRRGHRLRQGAGERHRVHDWATSPAWSVRHTDLTGNHRYPYRDVDMVFKALADPTRRSLLDELYREDGQTLSALGRLPMTRIGVMKHLGLLEDAGL